MNGFIQQKLGSVSYPIVSHAWIRTTNERVPINLMWDTGAQMTGVIYSVFNSNEQESGRKIMNYTYSGCYETEWYKTEITIDPNVTFKDVKTLACKFNDNDCKYGGVIGYDLISLGSFSIVTEQGIRILTYQISEENLFRRCLNSISSLLCFNSQKNKSENGILHQSFSSRRKGVISFVELKHNSNTIRVRALWDTGAETTLISSSCAKKLNLISIFTTSKMADSGATNINTYKIDIIFSETVSFEDVNVISPESEVGLVGVDMLIGMDIISQGDFMIKRNKGMIDFSFRKNNLNMALDENNRS